MSDIGTGATLTIDSWTVNIISMSHSGIERESIPTSHLGTTGGRTFLEGDLYDPGELEVEYQVDTENPSTSASKPPYELVQATVTIKFPKKPSINTAAQVSGLGFVTSVSPYTLELEGLVVGSLTIKFSAALLWGDDS